MSHSSAPNAPDPRRLKRIGILALVLAVALALTGIAMRMQREHALAQKIETDAMPTVSVIAPARSDSAQHLVLPGNVQAWIDAPIYARVSGYLKKWYVDIGAKVKAGDALADIETPELDQQLQQARADLANAQAREKLAAITHDRWQKMLAAASVSKQEADEKASDFQARQAEVAAARANVERLQTLTGFKRVVAPFDGTVTARKTDIGALIDAGGAGRELFRLADTRKLRVYVQVPQSYAGQIRVGMTAQLHLPERPGREYPATVASTADAIEESARTLLVQLEADNAENQLFAGSYTEVHFDLPAAKGTLQLPVTALMFRRHGMQVATVGAGDKVVLKNVRIGRDYGTHVEILDGLDANDRVIDSPPDWLAQGDAVRPESAQKKTGETHPVNEGGEE